MAVRIRKSALRRKFGFTLAELLIAVSIIAILALAGLSTMQNQTKRARDQRRAADLEQIRSALEMYRLAQPDRSYFALAGKTKFDVQDPDFVNALNNFIAIMPDDPLPANTYFYQRSTNSTYNLCAYLETIQNTDSGYVVLGANNCGSNSKCTSTGCNYRVYNP